MTVSLTVAQQHVHARNKPSFLFLLVGNNVNELDEIEEYSTVLVLIRHINGIVSQLREVLDKVLEYFPTRILT